jgi:type IV secretory pathway VirB2 component (pilin)
MNFFSKQISTIFLSLSFFLISSEGWAAEISVDIATCEPNLSSPPCSTTCGVDGNTYVFKVGGVAVAPTTLPVKATSPNAGTEIDVATCKGFCVNACITYRNGPEFAVASTSVNTFSRSICNAFRIVTGSAGKTFAAFAIIATGIGFFSGKVSWGLMIGVAAGIATMFGAPSIVAAISGTTVNTQCGLATGMPSGS